MAERFGRSPFRVLGRKGSYTVERELELEVEGLLGPKGAVVVERRNSPIPRHVIVAGLSLLDSFVTVSTKEMMLRFASPSFHEGNGSSSR
jgi:hypothetical protein